MYLFCISCKKIVATIKVPTLVWIEQNWCWGVVSGVLSNDNDDDDDDDDDEYSRLTVCNKNNEALIWS